MQSCNLPEESTEVANSSATAAAADSMDFEFDQLFELDLVPLDHQQQQQQFRNRASTWDPSFKRPNKLPGPTSGGQGGPTGLYVNCQSPLFPGADIQDDVAMGPVGMATGAPPPAPASCQECLLSVPSGPGSTASPGLASPASQLSASGLSPSNLSPHALQQQQQQKRRNAWGSQSYADLITQAIESNPQGRLTLSEIYDWMIKNIPYFGSRSDAASSAGWKNSVRHNLSLHNKFVRVQNDQTGKSSYWTVNYDARERHSGGGGGGGSGSANATTATPGSAAYRRRAVTADATRNADLQSKRAAVLARRAAANAAAAGANAISSSTPVQQAQKQQQQELHLLQPQPFTVAEVMRDLVPPEQLLDTDQDTEQLLFESLNDAVLQSARPIMGTDLPMHSLTTQMTQLNCEQQRQQQQQQQHQQSLFNSSGIGGSDCSWFDSLSDLNSLPDIIEAVDAFELQNQQQQQQQQSFTTGYCGISAQLQYQQQQQPQQAVGYVYQQPVQPQQQQQQQQQQVQPVCNCSVDYLMQEQA